MSHYFFRYLVKPAPGGTNHYLFFFTVSVEQKWINFKQDKYVNCKIMVMGWNFTLLFQISLIRYSVKSGMNMKILVLDERVSVVMKYHHG